MTQYSLPSGLAVDDTVLNALDVGSIIAPATTVGKVGAAIASQATTTTLNDARKHTYVVYVVVTITTLGSGNINAEVSYTDDNGVAHAACIVPLSTDAGSIVQAATTANSYHGQITINCNPNTTITVLTAGTFTTCTYNFWAGIERKS